MRWLKVLGTFYLAVAAITGMFYYLSYRVDCIQNDGFFSVFTGDCKATAVNFVTRTPPGLIESQFKGLLWPYHLFLSFASAQSITQSQYDAGLVEVERAVKQGDKAVIQKIRRLAQNVIDRENSNAGEIIDQDTISGDAELKGQVLIMNYIVRNPNTYALIQNSQKLFREKKTADMCRDPYSPERKVLDILFAGGYKINIVYKNQANSDQMVVFIDDCN